MKRKHDRIALLVAPLLLAVSLPAAAVINTWGTESCAGFVRNSLYASCTDTTPGPSLTYTAISDTATGNTLANAYVGNYGGHLGVTSRAGPSLDNTAGSRSAAGDETESSPNHAMDNGSVTPGNVGNYEMMLLSFASTVKLNAVSLGFYNTDSDLTVLAYTGGGAPGSFTGKTYGGATGLLMNGWSLIGQYADVYTSTAALGGSIGTVSNAALINGGGVSSSYWLIGAYNGTFGGTALSANNDYVKLLSIYGTPGGGGGQAVPEPSSLLLMGIALASLTMLRRRGVI